MKEITKAEMRKKLGNISQLQDLLFGDQIEKFNHQLAEYNQRQNNLETSHQKLQASIDQRLNQLETKLSQQINGVANSLDKKIQYVNITTQQNQQATKQDLYNLSEQTHRELEELRNNLKAQNHNFKTELTQAKFTWDRDLELLKKQIRQKLDSQLTELATGKVSRSDLAEVLFELCLKLREPDVHFELTESLIDSESIDLILPQNTVNNGNGQRSVEP